MVHYYVPHISSLGLKVAALAGSAHVGRPLAVCDSMVGFIVESHCLDRRL